MIEDVKAKLSETRLWLGFPHYVVLAWAILVSWQLWELRNWRDGFLEKTLASQATNTRLILTLTDSIESLQDSTRQLQDNQLRTSMILQFKFPKAAQEADDSLMQGD